MLEVKTILHNYIFIERKIDKKQKYQRATNRLIVALETDATVDKNKNTSRSRSKYLWTEENT